MVAPARRIRFPGSLGGELAARLDLPAGPPRAFALLAHCFTCTADLSALRRLASGLTERGIAVVRFDFTGLGSSEGEFGNTDFTSNVGDLVAAADWMREHHAAPQLLVGHSLGGAAVVVAAEQIPEVRAVATLGAPSDTEHLVGWFAESLDEIERAGSAEVDLVGRRFTISAGFVDDLRRHRVTECAERLDAALLVMHSPVDESVSVDHAARLYAAARHPKSFVGLDGADHLLTDAVDAAFAASMISSWAERYLVDQSGVAEAPSPGTRPAQVLVAETTQGAFLNHVVVGRHRFLADEPTDIGGFDAGPSPYDLVAAGLGACTSMTLRMYADRKELPLDRVLVEVTHDRVHAQDSAEAGSDTAGAAGRAKIDRFTRVVHLEGDLDDAAVERLLQIADRCPVHRTLEASSIIETRLA
ncbi:MAG: alpha/beta fold hydrolase [Ilumatobacter sp.]|nr:MAG: alpha/beta fold hydrolase [Ilumatobacter sp.]